MAKSQAREDSTPYTSRAGLMARGWTPALLRDHLGEPDKTAVNPHYRSAAPVQLYGLQRVEAAEARPAFVAARQRTVFRQARMRAVAEVRRQETLAAAEAWRLQVPVLAAAQLRAQAIARYNVRQEARAWSCA